MDFRTNFFSLVQLFVELSRFKKSNDVFVMHKEEEKPSNARIYNQMSAVFNHPVLREAARFCRGWLNYT